MKKIYTVLFAAMLCFSATHATHLMGGQITSENIGGLTYKVTLMAFRDTTGVPMYSTATIIYSDANGMLIVSHNVAVSPASSIGNGVEMYTYVDTMTFAAPGSFKISWEDCCRNAAILNLPTPSGNNFYLENVLLAVSNNSSPNFMNMPVTLAQVNVPFIYNPMPFDVDGDSLAWQLDVPLDGAMPITGYVHPSSDVTMPFSMNSATGEISFLPNALGNYVSSVLVKEYRAGVLIGNIRRDMQFLVVSSDNNEDSVTTTCNINPSFDGMYYVGINSNMNFTSTSHEPDQDYMTITANGEPFTVSNSPATFVATNGISQATGAFNWNTLPEHARTKPYFVVIRTTEHHASYNFITDKTLRIVVGITSGLATTDATTDNFRFYPVPAIGGRFNIKTFSNKNEKVALGIYDNAGREVYTKSITVVNGDNTIAIDGLSLTDGLYSVKLVGSEFMNQGRLVISK